MNLQEILADIHSLEEDLLAFERKFGIRSETFFAAYVSGEEPENDGWVGGYWISGSGLVSIEHGSPARPITGMKCNVCKKMK